MTSDDLQPPGGPVFVGGADRSGTTLMFALLASHPNLSMVRRTNLWRWFDQRYGDLSDPRNLERCLDDLVRYRRIETLQPDPDRLRREFLSGPATYGRLFELLHGHHAARQGKQRWGDKSLHTEHYAERIFTEFPDARVVQMVRDPRDRYASVRKRGDTDLRRVGAATGRWLTSVRAGLRNQRRFTGRYLMIRYEDLVADPATTMQAVCAFIGEPYDPAMLTMQAVPSHRVAGANSSFGDLEPNRISTRAVGRFRRVLTPTEIAFIQRAARRELDLLGYEPVATSLTPRQRLSLLVHDLPLQGARMAGWITVAALDRRRRRPAVPAARLRPRSEAS